MPVVLFSLVMWVVLAHGSANPRGVALLTSGLFVVSTLLVAWAGKHALADSLPQTSVIDWKRRILLVAHGWHEIEIRFSDVREVLFRCKMRELRQKGQPAQHYSEVFLVAWDARGAKDVSQRFFWTADTGDHDEALSQGLAFSAEIGKHLGVPYRHEGV